MLVTVAVLATLGAVLARRVGWVRDRLPPPASTALVGFAALVAATVVAGSEPGVLRMVVAGTLTVVLALAGVAAVGSGTARIRARVRRRRRDRPVGPSVQERVLARADASPVRIGRWNVVALTVRSVLRAGEVRVTGLAAEMSYYALISLVPIATALGSSLGFLRALLGDDEVQQIRESIVDGLTTVFAQQVAADVLAPLVDGLLREGRASFAIGALAITLYLASRVFRAAVRALDDAYRVPSRRSVLAQFLLGVVFTVGAVVALVVVVLLVVVGPLFGDGETIAQTFGLGDAFRVSWDVLRWPVVLALGTTFLTLLYRYAPEVSTTWRTCLPGAVFGAVGLLVVSTGFALYVRLAAPGGLPTESAAAVVQAAGQMLSLVLAGVLWLWLASIVVLLGGIINAEMDAEREAVPG